MLTSPFLTDLDPQIAVKGSRDPLGVQAVWARLGRHVVGNLTTVTQSVRRFTTVILGYYLAERVSSEEGGDGDLAVFLRWEQLAAYARAEINTDSDFFGVRRVKPRLNGSDRIRLSTDPSAQILSNQKTYGLWGLYTVSAEASGLIEGDPSRLTIPARELVDRIYLPIFTQGGLRNADEVVRRLAKAKTDLDVSGTDRRLLQTVAKVLDPRLTAAERAFYREHLLLGGPQNATAGRQAVLVKAFDDTLDTSDWQLSPPRVRHLAKRAHTDGPIGAAVAERLDRIRTAESVFAPAVRVYSFLLAKERQPIGGIADAVRRQWGASMRGIDVEAVRAMEPELHDSSGDPASGKRWVDVAASLSIGDYEAALRLLMDQNAFVMKVRGGGGPWADIVDGRLRVRFKDEAGDLPGRSDLANLWVHSYFLDSLRAIARQLRT